MPIYGVAIKSGLIYITTCSAAYCRKGVLVRLRFDDARIHISYADQPTSVIPSCTLGMILELQLHSDRLLRGKTPSSVRAELETS